MVFIPVFCGIFLKQAIDVTPDPCTQAVLMFLKAVKSSDEKQFEAMVDTGASKEAVSLATES